MQEENWNKHSSLAMRKGRNSFLFSATLSAFLSVFLRMICHLCEVTGVFYIFLYLFRPSDNYFLIPWSIISVCFLVLLFLLPLSPEASTLLPLKQADTYFGGGKKKKVCSNYFCQLSNYFYLLEVQHVHQSSALLLEIRRQFKEHLFIKTKGK